jgi:lipoate synthase
MRQGGQKMKEYLKNLRNENNEVLIEKLNYNQQNYNKWFDIYKYNRNDKCINYNMETFQNNMNKIKQVFKERKINIDFRNGWEIIKEEQ